MAEKTKYPRVVALAVAQEIYARLALHCERCKIAGSLRRGKKFVGDIEILYIPKTIPVTDLFGEPQSYSDLADVMINRWLSDGYLKKREGAKGVTSWGPINKLSIHVASGIPVDFFATTEAKWWNALVIRTGGKRMNLALTMSANARGLTLNAYGEGFTDRKTGEKILTHSEEEVFCFAGVDYREPQYRP